jgi:hypothetical protein
MNIMLPIAVIAAILYFLYHFGGKQAFQRWVDPFPGYDKNQITVVVSHKEGDLKVERLALQITTLLQSKGVDCEINSTDFQPATQTQVEENAYLTSLDIETHEPVQVHIKRKVAN